MVVQMPTRELKELFELGPAFQIAAYKVARAGRSGTLECGGEWSYAFGGDRLQIGAFQKAVDAGRVIVHHLWDALNCRWVLIARLARGATVRAVEDCVAGHVQQAPARRHAY